MVADAGESDEFITPQDHQRWMSMQVPFHTGEGFLTFGERSRGKTKFGRLCFTAKTNNNKPGKAKGKSPAAVTWEKCLASAFYATQASPRWSD
jgi:hypothetical protein